MKVVAVQHLLHMLCLKQATESTFLVDKGTLFQSVEADTANVRPPSVSLLYLGQIALKLAYRVFRE